MWWHCPCGPNHTTNGFLSIHGCSLPKGWSYGSRESYHSRPPILSEGKLPPGSRLKGDCAKHAAVAAENIEGHLAAREPKEAWQSIKGWYKAATNCVPKVSNTSLATQTADGVWPRMLHLQKHFWDTAKLVCHAGGNYGEPFNDERGVTQGSPPGTLLSHD